MPVWVWAFLFAPLPLVLVYWALRNPESKKTWGFTVPGKEQAPIIFWAVISIWIVQSIILIMIGFGTISGWIN